MAKPGTVTGWKLPQTERDMLLQRFPPKYEKVGADHVTRQTGATRETPLPHTPDSARVIGRADDGKSLECPVVEMDGMRDRPDASTYHITWSRGPPKPSREAYDGAREQR